LAPVAVLTGEPAIVSERERFTLAMAIVRSRPLA
jgi:hypothetical protein